MQNITASSQPT